MKDVTVKSSEENFHSINLDFINFNFINLGSFLTLPTKVSLARYLKKKLVSFVIYYYINFSLN